MNKSYKKYLKSADWQNKREDKLKIKRRCAICASPDLIDIHHLNYKNFYDVDGTDLRKLCRRCHFLAHDLHKQGIIKFRSTNHHSRFGIIKGAVKKYLGISTINMFRGADDPASNIANTAQSKLISLPQSELS